MDAELKQTLLQYPELLLSPIYDEDDNDAQVAKFMHALQIGFDIPDHIGNAHVSPMTGLMHSIANRDLTWRPEPTGRPINYYHWMSCETSQREPIWSMFSYLFEKRDPYYYEPYEHDEREMQELKEYYKYIKNKYHTAEAYVARIAACFHIDVKNIPIELKRIHRIAFA